MSVTGIKRAKIAIEPPLFAIAKSGVAKRRSIKEVHLLQPAGGPSAAKAGRAAVASRAASRAGRANPDQPEHNTWTSVDQRPDVA
jgi:hypothetical protein